MKRDIDNTTNDSEKALSAWGEKVFLYFWSHPSLFRVDGKIKKEFCDLFVIFNDIGIIFSLKDIQSKDGIPPDVGWKRWANTAIVSSISAVKGAEKHIKTQSDNIFYDTKCCEKFEPDVLKLQKIYKICIATGGKQQFKIRYSSEPNEVHENFLINIDKKSPVHIFTEETILRIAEDLDTINDLCRYLQEKESLIEKAESLEYSSESDLIAHYYLGYSDDFGGYTFSEGSENILLESGKWQNLSAMEEYALRKKANQTSYFIDDLINRTAQHSVRKTLEPGSATSYGVEKTLQQLAKLSRFERRCISQSMKDAIQQFPEHLKEEITRHTRFIQLGDTAYNFLQMSYLHSVQEDELRERRKALLLLSTQALAAKIYFSENPGLKTITKILGIGIYSPKTTRDEGNSEDFVFIDMDNHTDDDFRNYQKINDGLGEYSFWKKFEAQRFERGSEVEFPIPNLDNLKKYGEYNMIIAETENGLEVHSRDSNPFNGFHKKVGRNDKCPCGSGTKYKKCCLR